MKTEMSFEEIETKLKIIFPIYLKSYREQVNLNFREEYIETGDDIFNFMQPIKAFVLIREKNIHLLFYKNDVDKILFKDCNDTLYEKFESLNDINSKFKRIFIQSTLNMDLNYVKSFNISQFIKYGRLGLKQPNLESLSYDSGISCANDDYKNYELTKAFEKAITPSNKTYVVDSEAILDQVNDPSFQYEFEESIKAYNSRLYLAAAATGGIALENILRQLIIRELGQKYLPDKTYIWKSVDVLMKNGILSGRLRARINTQSEIRNTNAHTNDDPVTKETVDTLYSVIRDISNLFS